MKVAAIQSNYIPWRGYFDIIDEVDVFVIYDDVKYTKGDWRNRNKIKTPVGLQWLTVPVHFEHLHQLIQDVNIDQSKPWKKNHLKAFSINYAKAPFVDDALDIIEKTFAMQLATISELNVAFIVEICKYLGISTPLVMSRDYSLTGHKTDRLLDLLTKLGGTTYLSGPSAEAYIKHELFNQADITLEYKNYVYPPYPQEWGEFDGAVTVLDMIANCGPTSRSYLKSLAANKVLA